MSDGPPEYVPDPDEILMEAERQGDREASELPSWRISRDAAGTWLTCLMDIPDGGTVLIKAPTLDAIRIMDLITENWVDAARRAARRAEVR